MFSLERIQALRSMPYDQYLQTPEWQERREKALAWADHRCQVCYSTERLEVHHRTYERRGYESESDLTTLCHNCHERHHMTKEEEAKESQHDFLMSLPDVLYQAITRPSECVPYVLSLRNGLILRFDRAYLMKGCDREWVSLVKVYMWNFPGQDTPIAIGEFDVRVSEIVWVATDAGKL